MTKPILTLAILLLAAACHDARPTDRPSTSPTGIRFDFKTTGAKESSAFRLDATLFNDNTDTAYFLSWSCDGLIYQLKYDTSNLSLYPHYLCNMSYPIMKSIPPKGRFDFDAMLGMLKKEKTLKIGFNFIQIPSNFDLSLEHVRKYQEAHGQDILWAEKPLD